MVFPGELWREVLQPEGAARAEEAPHTSMFEDLGPVETRSRWAL